MTQEQPNDLMATSIEEVREESINEITDAGYGGVLQDEGFAATVKKINEDIKAAEIEETAKPKTTRRPRKKKVVEAEVPQE